MKGNEIPFTQRMLRGAIGRQFVIKHYRYGLVKTRYPDMSHVQPTPAQLECRRRFRLAMAWARTIMADPVSRSQWEQRTRKRKRALLNLLVKEYVKQHPVQPPVCKKRPLFIRRPLQGFTAVSALRHSGDQRLRTAGQQGVLAGLLSGPQQPGRPHRCLVFSG